MTLVGALPLTMAQLLRPSLFTIFVIISIVLQAVIVFCNAKQSEGEESRDNGLSLPSEKISYGQLEPRSGREAPNWKPPPNWKPSGDETTPEDSGPTEKIPYGPTPPPSDLTTPPPNWTTLPPNWATPPPDVTTTPPSWETPPGDVTTPPPDITTPPPNWSTPPAGETTPPTDLGTPPPNLSTPPAGETTPPTDLGTPPPNWSTPPADETTPPTDLGTPPPNWSTPPADETTPPTDLGTPPPECPPPPQCPPEETECPPPPTSPENCPPIQECPKPPPKKKCPVLPPPNWKSCPSTPRPKNPKPGPKPQSCPPTPPPCPPPPPPRPTPCPPRERCPRPPGGCQPPPAPPCPPPPPPGSPLPPCPAIPSPPCPPAGVCPKPPVPDRESCPSPQGCATDRDSKNNVPHLKDKTKYYFCSYHEDVKKWFAWLQTCKGKRFVGGEKVCAGGPPHPFNCETDRDSKSNAPDPKDETKYVLCSYHKDKKKWFAWPKSCMGKKFVGGDEICEGGPPKPFDCATAVKDIKSNVPDPIYTTRYYLCAYHEDVKKWFAWTKSCNGKRFVGGEEVCEGGIPKLVNCATAKKDSKSNVPDPNDKTKYVLCAYHKDVKKWFAWPKSCNGKKFVGGDKICEK